MIGTPRFQHGSLIRVKNKTMDDTWFLRYYQDVQGRRIYRKQKIGTVRELPTAVTLKGRFLLFAQRSIRRFAHQIR